MQTSKYMLANERDSLWGLTVTTIGHEKIEPFESYPTKGHADGYYFDLEKGRTLNEFQLLYNPEGEGCSTAHPSRRLTCVPATCSCSSPASGIPTTPPLTWDGRATG